MKLKDNNKQAWDKLIQKAQKGNQVAMTELYSRTYSQGFSVALQMVKNEEDAMDIMQNAYISAFKNLHTIREPEKFKNWFNCIVANKCRDFLRKHKEIVFSEIEADDSNGISYEETLESDLIEFSPEQSVDYSETKRLVNDILQALPQEQKLCILMYYYNELSVKEIAEALECSENTVKSRLNYARNKIKEGVKELEKKGTKLYNIAPIPLIVWMLRDSESAQGGVLSKNVIVQISKEVKKKVVKSLIGKSVIRNVVAGVAAVAVVSGATVGVICMKQNEAEQLPREVTSPADMIKQVAIDYKFLENLFCYLPKFHKEDAVTNEEFFEMMRTSMLYTYLRSEGNNLHLPTFLDSDKCIEKVMNSGEGSYWEYYVRFEGDTFDEVAEIIGFDERIDEEFLRKMDPEQYSTIWDNNTIKHSVDGIGGFSNGYSVEIVDKVIGNDTLSIDYILKETDYIEDTLKISNRTAVLKVTDNGYKITKVFEREGSTGAKSIAESHAGEMSVEEDTPMEKAQENTETIEQDHGLQKAENSKVAQTEESVLNISQEQIEARRLQNQLYREQLTHVGADNYIPYEETMYQFGVTDINGDGVQELFVYTYNPTNELDTGPNYMLTIEEDYLVGGGIGYGVMHNVEYCVATKHFVQSVYYDDGTYGFTVFGFEGTAFYWEEIDLSEEKTRYSFSFYVDAEGKYYYGDRVSEDNKLSEEEVALVKQKLAEYLPTRTKVTAPYAVTQENMDLYLPIDDAGIIAQLTENE